MNRTDTISNYGTVQFLEFTPSKKFDSILYKTCVIVYHLQIHILINSTDMLYMPLTLR